MRARWAGIAVLGTTTVLAAARSLAAQQLAPDLPPNLFERPSGPFAVGTREWLWVGSARAERYTRDPNDRRHLMVHVWYPAEPVAGVEPSLYIRTPGEFGGSSIYRRAEHIRTNS